MNQTILDVPVSTQTVLVWPSSTSVLAFSPSLCWDLDSPIYTGAMPAAKKDECNVGDISLYPGRFSVPSHFLVLAIRLPLSPSLGQPKSLDPILSVLSTKLISEIDST